MAMNAKIMVLDPAGNMWGSERVLLDFLGSDIIRGRGVGLCCPPRTPLLDAANKLGIKVYPFFVANLHKAGKIARLKAAIGLFKACQGYQAEVIYVNQAGATRIALLVGRLLKIPVIPHVRLLEDVRYIENLNVTLKAMPRVVVISKFIEEAFNKPEMIKRSYTLYDAYEMKANYPINGFNAEDSKQICCAGRLVSIKGQDILIRAIAELGECGENVILNLYGEGLPEDSFDFELHALVDKLDLDSKVLFHGYVENVPAKMNKQLAVICSSYIEPLGRVIFEAWDAGCLPVVGSFSGGAAEIVNLSKGGIIYDEQTPESLAIAIKRCLSLSPDEYRTIVERGRQWLKENCDSEKYSGKMIEILDGASQ